MDEHWFTPTWHKIVGGVKEVWSKIPVEKESPFVKGFCLRRSHRWRMSVSWAVNARTVVKWDLAKCQAARTAPGKIWK
jgi:hypothetical protein